MVQPKFSQEAKRLVRVADRINHRIALGHMIEFHGLFVKTWPEEKILRASMRSRVAKRKPVFNKVVKAVNGEAISIGNYSGV